MTLVGPVGAVGAVSVEFRHLRDRLTGRLGRTVPPCMIGEMVDEAVRQFEAEGAGRDGAD